MTPRSEAALEYAARGLQVFPVHSIENGRCTCIRPDCPSPGKHPRTFNGVKDATSDPQRVREWWSKWPNANVGLACGAGSSIFAIDVDPRHQGDASFEEWETLRPAGPLPPTRVSRTGGGGRHIFLRWPRSGGIGNRTNWLPGVDVRGEGGYVLLPPSDHASGGVYTWESDVATAEAPEDLVDDLKRRGRGTGSGELRDDESILQGVPEGQRDDVLFRACCRWRRLHKDSYTAVRLLALAAASRCDPPFPEVEALKKVDQAFLQDHSEEGDDEGDWLTRVADERQVRHLTDDGNALRLIDRRGSELRWTAGWGWLHWNGRWWARDELNTVMALAREAVQSIYEEAARGADRSEREALAKWARQSESSGKITAMVNLASSDRRIVRRVEDFDQDPWLLPVLNGVVHLPSGELLAHDSARMVTGGSDVEYVPGSRLEAWERYLDVATGGDAELRRYLQKAAGYTLTGDTSEDALFMVYGPAASGKSTFVDALMAVLGGLAIMTQAETLMHQAGGRGAPAGELARMYGKRMVATIETPRGERIAESLVKQMTGGDKVAARYLYQQGFEYRPTFKLWLATNTAPRVNDDAIWRRIKRVPFTNAVPVEERDLRLKEALRDPLVGGRAVLAWAVEGVRMWREEGLVAPLSVVMATEEYREEHDRLGAFLNECFLWDVKDHSLQTVFREIYSAYQVWATSGGERPMTSTALGIALKERGFIKTRTAQGPAYLGLTPHHTTSGLGDFTQRDR